MKGAAEDLCKWGDNGKGIVELFSQVNRTLSRMKWIKPKIVFLTFGLSPFLGWLEGHMDGWLDGLLSSHWDWSHLEYICLKFENVFVQMELLTFGSVPISWLRCGAYGLMEGRGVGRAIVLAMGFLCPSNRQKQTLCIKTCSNTVFLFSSNQKQDKLHILQI